MPESWETQLDELEHRVGALLEGRLDDFAPWAPPSALPPLPSELAPRAAVLVSLQREALTQLESERIRLAGELSSASHRSAGIRDNPAVYFDSVG